MVSIRLAHLAQNKANTGIGNYQYSVTGSWEAINLKMHQTVKHVVINANIKFQEAMICISLEKCQENFMGQTKV